MHAPVTKGGRPLQTAAYTTRSLVNQITGRIAGRGAVVAKRPARGPRGIGIEHGERTIQVAHILKGPDIQGALETLMGEHYTPWIGPETYVFEVRGSTRTCEVLALELARHPENSGPEDNGLYVGTWTLTEPVFYSQDPHTDGPETVPGALTLTNAGTVESRRVTYNLTPSAQKDGADGQRSRRQLTVVNVAPNELVDWPVLLTPGGWDHAAQVTAGDSHEDGHDVEAYVVGRRVPVWATPGTRGWDTANTHVWANLTLPPARSWELAGDIGAGDSSVQLKHAAFDVPATPFTAVFGAGGGGEEVVRVTGFDEATGTLTIQRGARNTAAAPWGTGARLHWAPVTVDLVWGWTSAPAPTYIDDRLKPIMIETDNASDNTAWQFGAFYETPALGDVQSRYPRAGSWHTRDLGPRDRERHEGGDQYTRWIPTVDGNPGTALGLEYHAAGAVAGRPIMDRWVFVSPIGLSEVQLDYDASDMGSGPTYNNEAALEVGYIDQDGNHVVDAVLDNLGVVSGTHTISPPAGTRIYAVVLRVRPWDPQQPDAPESLSALEPDEGDAWSVDTVSATFHSDERLVVVAPETVEEIYQFGRPDAPATLTGPTGDTLRLAGIVVAQDETLTIDLDTAAVTLPSGEGRGHLVTGTVPGAPAGGGDITFAETGGVHVALEAEVHDAWN